MSRLKPVDDDWILRRLERWGRKDQMPFLGPKKGVILQGLVREKSPRLAVEVGTMAGALVRLGTGKWLLDVEACTAMSMTPRLGAAPRLALEVGTMAGVSGMEI